MSMNVYFEFDLAFWSCYVVMVGSLLCEVHVYVQLHLPSLGILALVLDHVNVGTAIVELLVVLGADDLSHERNLLTLLANDVAAFFSADLVLESLKVVLEFEHFFFDCLLLCDVIWLMFVNEQCL